MSYRRGTSRTAIVEVDVDFDLEDFDEQDLIDYIEDKGYTVLEGKNNSKFETITDLDKSIWKLYQTFLLDKGDNNDMDRELRKFFAEYYNKVTV